MIRRRIANLEGISRRASRPYVVRIKDGETSEQARTRFFEPSGGETWPVAVMPEPCASTAEWLARYHPGRAI